MSIDTYTLKPFVELSKVEKLMVLQWRNYESVRRWMFSTDVITEEDHLNFFTTLENNTKTQYFLVQDGDRYIGVIDFTHIDYDVKECYFGLYANPFEKIKNVGKILEEISIDYAFNELNLQKIKAEILSNNLLAYLLHDSFGFVKTDEKIVNDKKVISMEKNKEEI